MNSTPLHCPQIDTSNLANWTGRPPGHEPVLVMRQGWNAGSDLEGGTVRFGWNGRGLLLHATLPDRDIFNPVTEFNEPAYLKGDVFEIFLRPLSQEAYYELHISPSNQLFQVRFPKNLAEAQPGETIDPTFVKVDLESTIRIDRQNECWEIFAEIPLAAICEDGPVLPESRWPAAPGASPAVARIFRRVDRTRVISHERRLMVRRLPAHRGWTPRCPA